MDDPSWPGLGMFLDDLPDDLRARIKSELVPGERLIWVARGLLRPPSSGDLPDRGCLLFAVGLFALSGACLAAFYGLWGGLLAGSPGWATSGLLAGVLWALLMMGMIGSWFENRGQAKRSANSVFALTDRRAITWIPLSDQDKGVEIHSIGRGKVGHIHRIEHPDGSGDVLFCSSPDRTKDSQRLGFRAIPEARRVEGLAREVLLEPAPGPEDE
jgi:hypothetical protein